MGAIDHVADDVTNRPIAYADVIATLYHQLGIDSQTLIHDPTGWPHVLMDHGNEIRDR